ncbi:hypothetical protein ACWGRB_05555 [Paenibacillus chitinolyticus]
MIEAVGERFEPREVPARRSTAGMKWDSASVAGATVKLRFSEGVLASALDRFYFADKRYEKAGCLQVSFNVSGVNSSVWLAETILRFGDGVEVLEPGELIADIRQRIEKMRNLYLKL